MPIPAVLPEPAARPVADHGEYALDQPGEAEPTTFRARPERRRGDVMPRRGKMKSAKRAGARRREREQEESRVSLSSVLIVLAAIAAVLALVGYFVPPAQRFVGVTLAVPGLVLCLYGYVTGVYIAFTEDDLYGWLFLLFPFYAAYYVVSRWDEMQSRLYMVIAGLVLLAVGGRYLEQAQAKVTAAAEAAEK
jgi:cation transport ATPase